MTDERRDDWGAAVHEAGHVVVAVLYGLQVKDVWIDDFGGGGGSSIQDPKEKALSVSQKVILCLAGGAAQKTFDAPTNPKFMDADWKIFRKITRDMTRTRQCAAKRSGYIDACAIIKRNADELKRLAIILYETEVIEKKRCIHFNEVQPPLRIL